MRATPAARFSGHCHGAHAPVQGDRAAAPALQAGAARGEGRAGPAGRAGGTHQSAAAGQPALPAGVARAGGARRRRPAGWQQEQQQQPGSICGLMTEPAGGSEWATSACRPRWGTIQLQHCACDWRARRLAQRSLACDPACAVREGSRAAFSAERVFAERSALFAALAGGRALQTSAQLACVEQALPLSPCRQAQAAARL